MAPTWQRVVLGLERGLGGEGAHSGEGASVGRDKGVPEILAMF